MRTFDYVRPADLPQAVAAVSSDPSAAYLAGGTTQLDLMKDGVLQPDRLVDITRLPLRGVTRSGDVVRILALTTMEELAADPTIRERLPVVREALLLSASVQLRNMATIAGNLLQRTRCRYFRDPTIACNKRAPGSGCSALGGHDRTHAILATSDHCIATHASDVAVALVALDAVVHTAGRDGKRRIPLTRFYLPPGEAPNVETVLVHGELITDIEVPLLAAGARSGYLKVRDRASYEFALTSAAVALVIADGVIRDGRVGSAGSPRFRGGRPLPSRCCAGRPRRWRRSTPLRRRRWKGRSRAATTLSRSSWPSARSCASWRSWRGHVMSSVEHSEVLPLVGPPVDRVDGPVKVTGTATYASDVSLPQLAHATLVRSTVAAGRMLHISTDAAEAAPGVLAVITHRNAAKLKRGPVGQRFMRGPVGQLVLTTVLRRASVGELFMTAGSPAPPLQDDRILHYGQPVAVVVAETAEQAMAAARLVEVDYDCGHEPLLDLDDPRAELLTNPWKLDMKRGHVAAALEFAGVRIEATYTTPDETNNPLGLFATVARWDGDRLTVHDSTQWPYGARQTLAAVFDVPEEGVRVLAPFVGGGFGAGLRVWPHVILAALAARMINRPVKLVLTRPQMFTSVGHRPTTKQRVMLGATRSGELVAIDHEATASVALEDDNVELVAFGTAGAYACPNLQTRDRQVRLNIACPGSMRAPGTAQGNFALESAIDELAYALEMDPLELRLRNYTATDPQSGLLWSSSALRDCYTQGAERFGWSRRRPEPRSMRQRHLLVGYGMAGVTYQYYQAPCQARASVRRDGRAQVRSAATDIGTGTYTVMTQLSAQILGLELGRVRFELGDTELPMAPWQGGSGLTGALGTAVHQACVHLVQRFLDVVKDDSDSPLKGCRLEDVAVAGGRIHRNDDPTRGDAYTDILARHQLEELTADGDSGTPRDFLLQGLASSAARLGRFVPVVVRATGAHAPAGAFAAKFVEVHVDPDLGMVRVARVVSAIDGGRILNEKTATSQIVGGTVGGIGMALLEETLTDQGTGRVANATLGDYLVPVNADIPAMDVVFVGDPDPMTPIGTKGVGEIGLVGIAAAIANAVFHATGRRIRSLPIRLEQLL